MSDISGREESSGDHPGRLSGAAFRLILAVIVAETAAQLLLKGGMGHDLIPTRWAVVLVVAGTFCYMAGFYLWLKALSRIDLSIAMPLVNLSMACVAVGGWWLYGENLGPQRLLGILLIFCGVSLCAWDSSRKRRLPPPASTPLSPGS